MLSLVCMKFITYLKDFFSAFLRHAAPLGLFVLLPLLVILNLGHNIITFESDKHISDISTRIDNSLIDIESEILPESFLLKVGRGAWFTFQEKRHNKEEFWNYYRNLNQFMQTQLDIYVFDDNGLLITPNNFPLKSRFIASKLWNTIFSDYNERINCVTKHKKQLRSFLGNEFKLGTFLDSCSLLMPIIVNTKNGFVYWKNFEENSKSGILMVFWDIPSYEFRLNQVIKRYLSVFSDIFIKESEDNFRYFVKKKNAFNDSLYKNIYLRTVLMNPTEGFTDDSGVLWKGVKLGDKWLLGGIRTYKRNYDRYHNSFVYFIFLIGVVIVSLYVLIGKKQNVYVSIRVKLIGLFLIAVITPVMAFSYLGYQYVNDMRENLVTEFSNESRDILLKIDSELGRSGHFFLEDFKKMVSDFQHYDEDENARNTISESMAKQDLVVLDRRNASDATSIKHITNNILLDNLNGVTESYAKCCIDRMYDTNLMDTVDPGLRNAMNSSETGLSSFWERPDVVQDIMMGSFEFYLYWCFVNTNNRTEFYLIMRMKERVLKELLYKRLKECKTKLKEKNYIILAHNDKKEEWIPDNSLANDLKAVSRRMNFIGKPIETQILVDSKPYLLFAIKSFKLRDYSFYALYPYENIENRLISVKSNIVACIVLFIIIALAIGYQLSGTFIYPVNRIEDGVKAIKERNSDFRIETLQNDEFGGLAQSFNKMIGDLKEMELAKYIQESLLPKALPPIKGYQLRFSNRMASAIGGDYFDVKLLDEDNLCIIIGDVSGHGVASALIMAIAKAVLYHGFKQTRDLIQLFSNLNSVINTYFNKPPVKKMITLFATIVNLPTGKSVFFDCGHNFPMKMAIDGQITELKMTGFPVGSQKKIRKKNTEEYVLNEGETIVFYTDGIIEATGKTSEQYGYDRFKNSISEMVAEDSDTIIKTLFENYEKWEDGTEPDDDVTLIVLKRLASQNNEGNIVC